MLAEENIEEESDKGNLNVQINVSRPLPLTFNIADFRRVVGLSSINRLTSGVFASFVPPLGPSEDVEDVNHVTNLRLNDLG
ncbi:hypothetical protein GN958_ATG11183 [Phytophthora infestans]|uniref:Uncharacterized protein n=1 Tax=Phytophthora infestans TaxID=4787 RepID=A0A8S9UMV5_PHYIN|nr:hypothetical protein GN958_ATG11183 [Phytophthora infestans]